MGGADESMAWKWCSGQNATSSRPSRNGSRSGMGEAAVKGNLQGQEMQGAEAGVPSVEQGPLSMGPSSSLHTAELSTMEDHATMMASIRLPATRTRKA